MIDSRESREPAAPVRVTISSLAQELGLTKSTVSKALNGYRDVSDATRARVEGAAKRLGYRPLSHAQAIRTGRSQSLGLVLSLSAHDGSRPFLAEFLDGLTRAASAEGWTLTIATAADQDELLETMGRLVAARQVDGFILPRTRHDDPRIALLSRHNMPFVLYGRSRMSDRLAWFDIDGTAAMAQAVARLWGFGHRRIGFVNAPAGFEYARRRAAGYCAGLRAAGLEPDPDLILEGAETRADGRAATLGLLRLPLPPTAILYATDMLALGAYEALEELGLTPGRDVSIIGYDGRPEGAYASPALTSFDVDNRAAGSRLASLLIQAIRGAEPTSLQETAPARLLARGSDGPPRCDSGTLAQTIRNTTKTQQGGDRS